MGGRKGDEIGALLRPPRLRPGDLVAIVNPSLALPGDEPLARLNPTVAALQERGLRVRVMPHVGRRWQQSALDGRPPAAILAGTHEERAADLNAAFADPAVRLILAAHGGGGAAHLLEAQLIDWTLLAKDPKLLCGFSDFSHLALTAYQQLRLVTIDGPTALQWSAPAGEPMLEQALRMMMQPLAAGAIPANSPWYSAQLPPTTPGLAPLRARPGGWRWLRPGQATGPLIVAMPGILAHLVELGLAPSLAGAIWCLDSYRDHPDRLAERLSWLAARGWLEGLAGLVVSRAWNKTPGDQAALDRVILETTAGLAPPPPILADVDSGHTWPKWSLANGLLATLAAPLDRFTIDEAAVR